MRPRRGHQLDVAVMVAGGRQDRLDEALLGELEDRPPLAGSREQGRGLDNQADSGGRVLVLEFERGVRQVDGGRRLLHVLLEVDPDGFDRELGLQVFGRGLAPIGVAFAGVACAAAAAVA